MKLYLIRHGQSTANLHHTHAGWGQVELTDLGKEQARRIGEFLRPIPFDKVYSSDLIRAIQTQQCALPQAEAERSPLIREIHVGSLSCRSIQECVAEYGETYRKNIAAHDFTAYGGENREQFCARIGEFLAQMEASPYERVAAFCHAGVIHHTLDLLFGTTVDKSLFACDNCGVYLLEFTDGRWRIVLWNFTGNL